MNPNCQMPQTNGQLINSFFADPMENMRGDNVFSGNANFGYDNILKSKINYQINITLFRFFLYHSYLILSIFSKIFNIRKSLISTFFSNF